MAPSDPLWKGAFPWTDVISLEQRAWLAWPHWARAPREPRAAARRRNYLELRLYRCEPGAMRERFEHVRARGRHPRLEPHRHRERRRVRADGREGGRRAAIDAAQRHRPRGRFVLRAHKSIELFATANRRLWADAEFQKAGAALLDPPKASPTYKRIESWLMLAFDQCPHLEPPKEKKETRVFQLRTYESHSEAKAIKKIEMFNTGGEIALFRTVGVNPVFFGQAARRHEDALPDLHDHLRRHGGQ